MKITFKYHRHPFGLSILSIAIFYFMNLHNRRAVESQTLALAVSEGKTIEKVMDKAAVHLLEKGESDLIRFMNEIFGNDQVIYIALGTFRPLASCRQQIRRLPADRNRLAIHKNFHFAHGRNHRSDGEPARPVWAATKCTSVIFSTPSEKSTTPPKKISCC